MAVIFACGFEAQQAQTDTGSSFTGTASYSTAQHRTGAASMRCNPASGVAGGGGGGDPSNAYHHFGFYVATLPSLERRIYGPIGIGGLNVRLTPTGTLTVYDNTTLLGTSSAAFATPGWHWVGIRQATGTSVVFLQIDGLNEVTATATITQWTSAIGFLTTEASAADVFVDDIVIDSAGFLASTNVDTAFPISDNTVTGVTDNNGVTTNIWDAVNNTPPVGVASANEAANPKTGMHYPSAVSCTYVANMETYTTLGVASASEVIAVQPVLRHGEDIATGTKNGALPGVSANPSLTESGTFVFGGDAGAHAAEVGLWVTKFGTMRTVQTDPISFAGITVGTSPTVTTTRLSESRVGCADFIGLIVVWTPVVARVPYVNPMPQLLAQ